jgi:MoxR-like ATPase
MAITDKKIIVTPVVGPKDIIRARKVVDEVYIDERIEKYIIDIVFATREPKTYRLDELTPLIQYGASPRASIYLSMASKAYAFLQGRGYVVPQDIKTIGMDVLRHRIIASYEAEAEDKTSEDIIKRIFEEVKVP